MTVLGIIGVVVIVLVVVATIVLVVVLALQQRRARPLPGDIVDIDGRPDYGAGAPSAEGTTSSGDMLPGPGPTGFGAGGRMQG